MQQELYPWQEDCLKRWFANNGRGMVQAVTGSGKTLLALTAAKRLSEKTDRELRVKIVVPTSTLMHQWNHTLRNFLDENTSKMIGLRGGGYKSAADCRYMIYVINSARYELARQILSELHHKKAVLLIADECHHYTSRQNQLIFEFLPHLQPDEKHFFHWDYPLRCPPVRQVMNLPQRLDAEYTVMKWRLRQRGAPCAHTISSISDSLSSAMNGRNIRSFLIECLSFTSDCCQRSRNLADSISKSVSSCFAVCQVTKTKGSRTQHASISAFHLSGKIWSAWLPERLDCAYDLIKSLGIHDKILVFGERIRQAEELYTRLRNDYPGKVGRYHSKLGNQANKNAMERFRLGDIRILIACKAIDEGVDVPDTAIGIILSGTSTQRQRVQRLGRIIRQKEGKESALLYYLHITESSEDACFLPNASKNRIFDLEYLPNTGSFMNHHYMKNARILIERMQEANLPEKQIQEALRCFDLGVIKADWMIEIHAIEQHIQNAKTTKERNYWMCMKKMAELQ